MGNGRGRKPRIPWKLRNYCRFSGRICPIRAKTDVPTNKEQRLDELLSEDTHATAFLRPSCASYHEAWHARLTPPFHRAVLRWTMSPVLTRSSLLLNIISEWILCIDYSTVLWAYTAIDSSQSVQKCLPRITQERRTLFRLCFFLLEEWRQNRPHQ